MERSKLDLALAHAKRGWAVLPCLPGEKRPATRNGVKAAVRDPEIIHRWWTETPDANIGIALGRLSGGLVVLELEEARLRDALAAVVDLPATYTVVTPGGGLHLYYRASGDETIATRRGGVVSGVRLDVAADGAYVLGAGSALIWPRPTGDSFSLALGDWCVAPDCPAEVAEAPDWLVERRAASVGDALPLSEGEIALGPVTDEERALGTVLPVTREGLDRIRDAHGEPEEAGPGGEPERPGFTPMEVWSTSAVANAPDLPPAVQAEMARQSVWAHMDALLARLSPPRRAVLKHELGMFRRAYGADGKASLGEAARRMALLGFRRDEIEGALWSVVFFGSKDATAHDVVSASVSAAEHILIAAAMVATGQAPESVPELAEAMAGSVG